MVLSKIKANITRTSKAIGTILTCDPILSVPIRSVPFYSVHTKITPFIYCEIPFVK